MPERREAPSLVDLCVYVAIDNVRYLGNAGETDLHLLDRILPYCTLDQLKHVEESIQGRVLSSVTDKLWKRFYEKQFVENNLNNVLERMRQHNVSCKWKDLYQAKLTAISEKENEVAAGLRQLYQKEDAKKQSRQIRICTKVPQGNKRSFFGSGPGYNLSSVKSNIMNKSKLDFFKSREVQNIVAMKKISAQRKNSTSPVMKPPALFPGNNSGSSSRQTNFSRGKF